MKRHQRDVARIAREHGLVVRVAHSGHLRLVDPTTGDAVATASSTPTCADNALKAIRRDLRRHTEGSGR